MRRRQKRLTHSGQRSGHPGVRRSALLAGVTALALVVPLVAASAEPNARVVPLVAASAEPMTTPVSEPPDTTPTTAPSPLPSRPGRALSITPARGPVGTEIAYVGNCGREPAIAAGLFAAAPNSVTNPFVVTSTYFALATRDTVADPTTPALLFRGRFVVPIALGDGSPVMSGLYYVTGVCCLDIATCSGDVPLTYTPARPFCVSDPENPCDGWTTLAGGRLGAQYFSTGLFLNQIAAQFALSGASVPAPPPPEPTPTKRLTPPAPPPPPPTTAPPAQPLPTTTTTVCVVNPKPPPKCK